MAYGDLNYTTEEINADLKKVHDKLAVVEEAPSDGKQYGRKDGAWAEIEASTQYLDLSMFSEASGTLPEEDYQKVVKAYEDKITNAYFPNEMTTPSSIFSTGDGSFMILCYLLSGSASQTDIIVYTFNVNADKSYSYTANGVNIITGNDGTKALTDNGQYAKFAKPTKVESGGSGAVTKQIKPNTFYKFGEVTNLTISFAAEESGIINEYMFEFVSGATPTTLSLPDSVKWSGGSAPTIEASKTYQVSIVNNLAVYASF